MSQVSNEELAHIVQSHIQKYGATGDSKGSNSGVAHIYLTLARSLQEVVKEVVWNKSMSASNSPFLEYKKKVLLLHEGNLDLDSIMQTLQRFQQLSGIEKSSATGETYDAYLCSQSLLFAATQRSISLLSSTVYQKSLEDLQLETYLKNMEEEEIQIRVLKSQVETHNLPHWKTLADSLTTYWKDVTLAQQPQSKYPTLLSHELKTQFWSLYVSHAVSDMYVEIGKLCHPCSLFLKLLVLNDFLFTAI